MQVKYKKVCILYWNIKINVVVLINDIILVVMVARSKSSKKKLTLKKTNLKY